MIVLNDLLLEVHAPYLVVVFTEVMHTVLLTA